MAYWHLFYHAVWATKARQPLITADIEGLIYQSIREKAVDLGGMVFAINGIADHVHLVTTIPPRIAVAEFIGQVKGATSYQINRQRAPMFARFAWQEAYGVFSVDGKRLSNLVAYVENQKQHHSRESIIPILERYEEEQKPMMREITPAYLVEDTQWRLEMMALSAER
jgi:putative transposase